MKKALLVIDLDRGNGWDQENVRLNADRQKVAKNVLEMLEKERQTGTLIIFIVLAGRATGQEVQTDFRHLPPRDIDWCLPEEAPYLPAEERPEVRIGKGKICIACDRPVDERLAEFLHHRHDGSEPVFVKNTGDAFQNHSLPHFLKTQDVGTLVLVGCNTCACVFDTACGAMSNGFNVVLREKGSYPPFQSNGEREWWLEAINGRININTSGPSVKIIS